MIGILAILAVLNFVVASWDGTFWPNTAMGLIILQHLLFMGAKKVHKAISND